MKRDVIIALDFKDAETALAFLDKFTDGGVRETLGTSSRKTVE